MVEPYGEWRTDLREAWHTLHKLQAQSTKKFGEETRQEILNSLLHYLPEDEPSKNPTPDEAAQQGKAAFARIGKA